MKKISAFVLSGIVAKSVFSLNNNNRQLPEKNINYKGFIINTTGSITTTLTMSINDETKCVYMNIDPPLVGSGLIRDGNIDGKIIKFKVGQEGIIDELVFNGQIDGDILYGTYTVPNVCPMQGGIWVLMNSNTFDILKIKEIISKLQ